MWSKEGEGVGAPKPSRPQACVGGTWGVRRVWEERGSGGGGACSGRRCPHLRRHHGWWWGGMGWGGAHSGDFFGGGRGGCAIAPTAVALLQRRRPPLTFSVQTEGQEEEKRGEAGIRRENTRQGLLPPLTMADWSEIKVTAASFCPTVLFLSERPVLPGRGLSFRDKARQEGEGGRFVRSNISVYSQVELQCQKEPQG